MRVTKWGDSLAVRIPADVAEALHIKEGDEVDVVAATDAVVNATPDEERRQALEKIRSLRWTLPPEYKFDRDEANER
ncbi:AbrB/MazE/SpoVT family DNA-binding domain-containing protein [Agrobacterium tumefaciens]|uniref:AbrB/MazE/SpoVT family DNA-binding domain-containing protein n=1 Tax=Agrobacterium tumefaciens TaxID=358 RepID=UPI001ADB71C3|nr:AbrB/MazE/SpoVT family DNA-binding domain-containing protein [Agrobacterium tumefaciens]QTK79542.1 AbrB/MazE/SpoVT family DNA-binding domain-containing protein [Agrobacterium tumefaciens]